MRTLPTLRLRHLAWWLVLGLTLLLAGLLLYSVRTTLLRVALLADIAAIYALLLALSWRRRPARYALLAPPILLALLLLLPARRPDPAALRAAYVHSLLRFQGTPYIWGGETHRGIDCSGLVRSAYVNAHVREAILGGNPGLLRHAFSIWFNDCSARTIAEGYAGQTLPQRSLPRLRDADPASLLPGDLAITHDGVHVLAYLGDGRWIEADPTALSVLILDLRQPASEWLSAPATVVRWRALAEHQAAPER